MVLLGDDTTCCLVWATVHVLLRLQMQLVHARRVSQGSSKMGSITVFAYTRYALLVLRDIAQANAAGTV